MLRSNPDPCLTIYYIMSESSIQIDGIVIVIIRFCCAMFSPMRVLYKSMTMSDAASHPQNASFTMCVARCEASAPTIHSRVICAILNTLHLGYICGLALKIIRQNHLWNGRKRLNCECIDKYKELWYNGWYTLYFLAYWRLKITFGLDVSRI